MKSRDSLKTLDTLTVAGKTYRYFSLATAESAGMDGISRLPFSLKVLLENLLRHEDGVGVTEDDIRALAAWPAEKTSDRVIAFYPTRVLMQDMSGVPLLADVAAMRDAMIRLGGDASVVDPLTPVDLVVDHSIITDFAATGDAMARNVELEFTRNAERYGLMRWAQNAFENVRVVPPGNGICHQVNVEFLARVAWPDGEWVYPDSVLGMDSHTPMVNGLGVVGWGAGGIEAGAAILGEPVTMRLPEVIGCRLVGRLPDGATSTDLVLSVTEALRAKGVVGRFVEFFGPGLDTLPVPDRSTIANMAPEYGATMGYFPVDRVTIEYLRATGREDDHVALVEAYVHAQGLWRNPDSPGPAFTDTLEIDLGAIGPTVAGPRRPHDRVALADAAAGFAEVLDGDPEFGFAVAGRDFDLHHGDLAIAGVTSCTNTSNPGVMLGAGLLARNAVARGLKVKPWVKTSFAPGSRIVADYLAEAGLQKDLDALGFNVVGFGCMTCVGNSGPLDPAVTETIEAENVMVGAVTSANRNFDGRVHSLARFHYLASPPLVIAYALAGTFRIDLTREPLGEDAQGDPVYLADIWPAGAEISDLANRCVSPDMYRERYADAYTGGPEWQALDVSTGATFEWDDSSTYIRQPPFFMDFPVTPPPVTDIKGARPLAILGDSITTDHISPVGSIHPDSAAGRYLLGIGIEEKDFNAFGARRVNHDVILRGTFGNIRLRNEMVPGTEGGFTRHMPGGDEMFIYDAAMKYAEEGVPLVVIAGKQYGSGSARDWAAKGTSLLGIRAVIAEGLERIHRSNLVCMGVLPLQFQNGVTRETLRLDGSETFDVTGLKAGITPGMDVQCRVTRADGSSETITLTCRLDTPYEVEYHRQGGILNSVLRKMIAKAGIGG